MSAGADAVSPSPLPFHLGTPEQFATVRSLFGELRYDEASICARVGVPNIFEFPAKADGRQTGIELQDALGALIHLFLDGELLADDLMRRLLPADLISALQGLGVLARLEAQPDSWYGTVWLYPVASVYIISDRPKRFEGAAIHTGTDLVFTAGSWSTRQFLDTIPHTPCNDLLDLCCGCGVAALVGARSAGRVWACDLAERSVRFTEFGARLNGVENVTCAQGDLYAPVADLRFDRIVSHPPYVPGRQTFLYKEGGEDGEEILRGVVEGLPRHLKPGGCFYTFVMGTDRAGGNMESRIRGWLGQQEKDFDIFLIAYDVAETPSETVYREVFRRLKVTGAYFTAVVIARIETARPAITARTRRAAKAGNEAIEWFVNWQHAAAAAGFNEFLWQSRPHMSPRLCLQVKHTVTPERKLLPSRLELHTDYPFKIELPCPGWVASLVSASDGTRTPQQMFGILKQQGALDANVSEAAFVRDVRELVALGLLEMDEFPLPQPQNA